MCEICGTMNDVLALCGFNVCSECINRELGKSVEEFMSGENESYHKDKEQLMEVASR